jgi:hypothetical protein
MTDEGHTDSGTAVVGKHHQEGRDVDPIVLLDNTDPRQQTRERQRSVVLSSDWANGVRSLLLLTLLAEPTAGSWAVLERLGAEGVSAKIVLDVEEFEALVAEVTGWRDRYGKPRPGQAV